MSFRLSGARTVGLVALALALPLGAQLARPDEQRLKTTRAAVAPDTGEALTLAAPGRLAAIPALKVSKRVHRQRDPQPRTATAPPVAAPPVAAPAAAPPPAASSAPPAAPLAAPAPAEPAPPSAPADPPQVFDDSGSFDSSGTP